MLRVLFAKPSHIHDECNYVRTTNVSQDGPTMSEPWNPRVHIFFTVFAKQIGANPNTGERGTKTSTSTLLTSLR